MFIKEKNWAPLIFPDGVDLLRRDTTAQAPRAYPLHFTLKQQAK